MKGESERCIVLKRLTGHSGCDITLCRANGIFVRKRSSSQKYNRRLKKQYRKQQRFVPKTENVLAPRPLSCGTENGLFYFDMEFVRGKTLAEYTAEMKISEIADYVDVLFESLEFSPLRHSFDARGKQAIFSEKIETLNAQLQSNTKLGEAFGILKNFDWSSVPETPCHGDLTLENILVSDNGKLYLFDFLDSFFNSWMIDIAKLLQDLELKWSFRHSSLTTAQELRLLVAKEMIVERIVSFKDGMRHMAAIYHLLLLNVLRIYPYAKDEVTYAFLDSSVEYLLEKLRKNEIGGLK